METKLIKNTFLHGLLFLILITLGARLSLAPPRGANTMLLGALFISLWLGFLFFLLPIYIGHKLSKEGKNLREAIVASLVASISLFTLDFLVALLPFSLSILSPLTLGFFKGIILGLFNFQLGTDTAGTVITYLLVLLPLSITASFSTLIGFIPFTSKNQNGH